ncbi:4a-hydroxytetrahydrobiopterin dehydratase [Thiomicrospira microaerophila]|uniref:4a-hydroxytetrahydrobiopterin dehydratase n=1 Tax=Thiomicrospira microaerophila TaxID=406020 RepID=UPI00200D65BF|nr:4a-hydroxytetrahydrobiopterin dehydratase [Thiomicrospira microaerophila]UQB42446.1 4a-hydroxytetrahydrobiopterin dehydratase [Thiomicrospira microaerophila]
MIGNWKQSRTGTSLEVKYLFDGYSSLRDFLDEVANVTESIDIHPNMSFGRDYASLVIHAVGEDLSDAERDLAAKIDLIYQQFK